MLFVFVCAYQCPTLIVLCFCPFLIVFVICLILATINQLVIMPGTFRSAANIFLSRKKELVCTNKIVPETVLKIPFTSFNG